MGHAGRIASRAPRRVPESATLARKGSRLMPLLGSAVRVPHTVIGVTKQARVGAMSVVPAACSMFGWNCMVRCTSASLAAPGAANALCSMVARPATLSIRSSPTALAALSHGCVLASSSGSCSPPLAAASSCSARRKHMIHIINEQSNAKMLPRSCERTVTVLTFAGVVVAGPTSRHNRSARRAHTRAHTLSTCCQDIQASISLTRDEYLMNSVAGYALRNYAADTQRQRRRRRRYA